MHEERVLQLARGNQEGRRRQVGGWCIARCRQARSQRRNNYCDDDASTEHDAESAHTPLYITATEVVTEVQGADHGGVKCYCCGLQMSSNRKVDVAIVGAGILGLAHAYFAAKRGHKVVVFERTPMAQGASVRNFGMIWPIGQRAGVVHQMAMRSRQIWNEILDASGLDYRPTGSLHVVYHQDEADVAHEFVERAPRARLHLHLAVAR